MWRLIQGLCLSLFLAFFLVASILYFSKVAHPAQFDSETILQLGLLAIGAGVALSQFLYHLHIIPLDRFIFRAAVGALMGIVIFSAIFFTENIMTTIELTRARREPAVFSVVDGHCGVYSGYGASRWYALALAPSTEHQMESFLFSNQCRLKHFLDLRRRQQLPCNAQEDPLSCLTRWMQTFSKNGFWNLPTRKMFLEEAEKDVIKESNNDVVEQWLIYVLQDHELESSRPPLMQQAGISEDFNDLHHYFKVKDEYQNLVFTRDLFAFADKRLSDDQHSGELAGKYKEAKKIVRLKVEKIPELEENLKLIQAKLNYSPSL